VTALALVRSGRAGVPGAAVRAALAGGGWQRGRALTTVSGTAVIMVTAPDGRTGVLKIAANPAGAASLRRERAVLRTLCSDDRLGGWRDLLPVPLNWGESGDSTFLLTSRLPGRVGRRLPTAEALTRTAFGAIAPLHRHGQTVAEVDATLLRQWLDEPAQRLTAVAGAAAAGRVTAAIHAGLAGRRVTLGWTHGDFHPGNVLVRRDRVAGIVDWDQARERDLIATDATFWLLTTPGAGRRRALGAQVAARLRAGRCWTPAESRLLDLGQDPAAGRALLLLAWLRHVAGNLAKSERYARSPLWLRTTVRPVLRQVR
jgi:aminoglycoside phosphotransferase